MEEPSTENEKEPVPLSNVEGFLAGDETQAAAANRETGKTYAEEIANNSARRSKLGKSGIKLVDDPSQVPTLEIEESMANDVEIRTPYYLPHEMQVSRGRSHQPAMFTAISSSLSDLENVWEANPPSSPQILYSMDQSIRDCARLITTENISIIIYENDM